MDKHIKKLIKTIDEYVKKAPALPKNIKDLLVQLAPWGVIISVVAAIPTILSVLGFGSYIEVYEMRNYMFAHVGVRYFILTIFLIASLVLRGLSISGLFAKSTKGWDLLFYSILLSAIYSLVNFDIIGGIISTVLSLYLLFQVREYYK